MASIAHCHYCFDVLVSHLEDRPPRTLAELEALVAAARELTPGLGSSTNGRSSAAPAAVLKTPLFVTWKKASVSSGQLDLRGCIGTFEAKPLEAGLKDYALTAWVPPQTGERWVGSGG
jgi:AMMECR1 domain-containing protein